MGTHFENGRPRVSQKESFVRDLLSAEPRLALVYQAHLADNDELLLHVFLGDVTRWLREHGPVASVLALLEWYLGTGTEAVQNAIAASFVENLEAGDVALRRALGPRLRAELEAQESWTPPDHDQPT